MLKFRRFAAEFLETTKKVWLCQTFLGSRILIDYIELIVC